MRDRRICRFEAKFTDGVDAATEAGQFEGYGAIFGNVDAYGDLILKGAFKQTLRAWKSLKKLPPMLLQHAGGWFGGADDFVPVGVWDEMIEDEKGLFAKGHLLAMATDRGQQVYEAMKAGSLDGLSIGYRAKEFVLGTNPTEPPRTLKQVELVEVSIVTFPANEAAVVDAVKAGGGLTEREFERFLRDAGFSRDEAKTIVAEGYRALKRDVDERGATADIVASLKALTERVAAAC